MEVEIRAATPGEEREIVAMYEWLFAPPGVKPDAWDEKRAAVALREAIESHDSAVLVAEGGGHLVGFLTAYLDLHSVRFGHRVWVEDFAVHPDRRSVGDRQGPARRGQGVGARTGRDASGAGQRRGAQGCSPLL